MFSLAGFLVRQGAGWNTEIKKIIYPKKKEYAGLIYKLWE